MALVAVNTCGQNAGQPAPAQQAHADKNGKIWTDDNIDSVRSAEDVYLIQVELMKEKLEAEKAAAAKLSSLQVCSAGPIVKSVQQADEMIAQDNQDLKAQQDYIKQTEDQLSSAPDDASKTRLEWRIQSRSATAARIQDEIASLKKQRDTLAKNAPAAATPAGGSSGPAQQ
jgi:hypothetical protein